MTKPTLHPTHSAEDHGSSPLSMPSRVAASGLTTIEASPDAQRFVTRDEWSITRPASVERNGSSRDPGQSANGTSHPAIRARQRIVTCAGQAVPQRPRPAGAAARRADRPTGVAGPPGPTRGQGGAPAGRQPALGPSQFAGVGGRGRTTLTPGAFGPGGIPAGRGHRPNAAGCRVPAAPRPILTLGPSPLQVIC
jgi:hypothetical protein